MIENIIDSYEEMMLINDPLTQILNKGDVNEFEKWFNNWKPYNEKEKIQLNNFINDIIIPKLIVYEYYEWIKLLKK